MKAGHALMKMKDELNADSRKHIASALHEASENKSGFSRAWIMRKALDRALANMK